MRRLMGQELLALRSWLIGALMLTFLVGSFAAVLFHLDARQYLTPEQTLFQLGLAMDDAEQMLSNPNASPELRTEMELTLKRLRDRVEQVQQLQHPTEWRQAVDNMLAGLEAEQASLTPRELPRAHELEREIVKLAFLLESNLRPEDPSLPNAWRLVEWLSKWIGFILLLPAMLLGAGLASTIPQTPEVNRLQCLLSKVAVLVLSLLLIATGLLLAAWVAYGIMYGWGSGRYPIVLMGGVRATSRWLYIIAANLNMSLVCGVVGSLTLALGLVVVKPVLTLILAAIIPIATHLGTRFARQLFGGGIAYILRILSSGSFLRQLLQPFWWYGGQSARVEYLHPALSIAVTFGWWVIAGLLIVSLRNSVAQPTMFKGRRTQLAERIVRLRRSIRWKLIFIFFISVGVAFLGTIILVRIAYSISQLSMLRSASWMRRLMMLATSRFGVIPFIMVLGSLLFVITFLVLSKRFVTYLEEISVAVQQIANGSWEVRLPQRSSDEIGELADNINRMAIQISSSIEEERRTERSKHELITNVSHDLRTPLTSILGYLELISLGDEQGEADIKQHASIAHSKALRLQRLIDELFEYTRLTGSGYPLKAATLDLRALLSQLADELTPLLQQAEMDVSMCLGDEPVWLVADGDLLARVFENLLTNAMRYGREGRVVEVRLAVQSGLAQIEVANYGPEIPAEVLPHIFERFYRVEKSRSAEHGGAGLGLAIAKQIVERHNGSIQVESGEGKTAFRVHLPLHTA